MTVVASELKGLRSQDKQSIFANTIWVQLIACRFERVQETFILEKAITECFNKIVHFIESWINLQIQAYITAFFRYFRLCNLFHFSGC